MMRRTSRESKIRKLLNLDILGKKIFKNNINDDLKKKLFGLLKECDQTENSEGKFEENVAESIKCWIKIMARIYFSHASQGADTRLIREHIKKEKIQIDKDLEQLMTPGDGNAQAQKEIDGAIVHDILREIEKVIKWGENIIRYNVDIHDDLLKLVQVNIDMIRIEKVKESRALLQQLASKEEVYGELLAECLSILDTGQYNGELRRLKRLQSQMEQDARLRPVRRRIELLKYEKRMEELTQDEKNLALEERRVESEEKRLEIEKAKARIKEEMDLITSFQSTSKIEEENDKIAFGPNAV